jgi:hypothetical protein
MTRKAELQIALAMVVLGALVWAAWPERGQGVVNVTYAGVSSSDSSRVVFTITNSSTIALRYRKHSQEHPYDGETMREDDEWYAEQKIMGHSATNFDITFLSTNRWRIWVRHDQPFCDSFVTRIRIRLGHSAWDHGWLRTGNWLGPWKPPTAQKCSAANPRRPENSPAI